MKPAPPVTTTGLRCTVVRLVLANHAFARVGGTEKYLLTLAEHLQRLGHEAVVYAHELGPYSDHARECGVEVTDQLRELPERCDIAFAQDAIVAYELAERYADAPLVFRACSDVYDFELPPQLDGVVDQIVVVSDRYARLVEACAVSAPVMRLRIPVDLARHEPRGRVREQPRRAVILGNYPDRFRAVSDAWGRHGVEVAQVGIANQRYDVAAALEEADIVVAKSRAAVEAMACGRPVYVFDVFGGDGWVTQANYAALEADNFAGQGTDRVIDAASIERDLRNYDPGMGAVNRDLALQHHSARDHVIQLIAGLEGLRPGPRPSAPLRELARLTSRQWSSEREAHALRRDMRALNERTESALAEAQRETDRAEQALAEVGRAAADAEHALADARRAAAIAEAAHAEEVRVLAECEAKLREELARRPEPGQVEALEEQLRAIRATRIWRAATHYWRLRRRLGR